MQDKLDGFGLGDLAIPVAINSQIGNVMDTNSSGSSILFSGTPADYTDDVSSYTGLIPDSQWVMKFKVTGAIETAFSNFLFWAFYPAQCGE